MVSHEVRRETECLDWALVNSVGGSQCRAAVALFRAPEDETHASKTQAVMSTVSMVLSCRCPGVMTAVEIGGLAYRYRTPDGADLDLIAMSPNSSHHCEQKQ